MVFLKRAPCIFRLSSLGCRFSFLSLAPIFSLARLPPNSLYLHRLPIQSTFFSPLATFLSLLGDRSPILFVLLRNTILPCLALRVVILTISTNKYLFHRVFSILSNVGGAGSSCGSWVGVWAGARYVSNRAWGYVLNNHAFGKAAGRRGR